MGEGRGTTITVRMVGRGMTQLTSGDDDEAVESSRRNSQIRLTEDSHTTDLAR
jgi:hypothetical protein